MDLTEAEGIKKRWQEYIEELNIWLKQRPRIRFCREEEWGVNTATIDLAEVMWIRAMC